MAQSAIINAFIEKRAELSGFVTDPEGRTYQARADLAHIDATLRPFDPEAIPASIQPKALPLSHTGDASGPELRSREEKAGAADASQDGISAARNSRQCIAVLHVEWADGSPWRESRRQVAAKTLIAKPCNVAISFGSKSEDLHVTIIAVETHRC